MEFYINVAGKQHGPLDVVEFRDFVRKRTVSPEDYVWDAEQSRWIKIKFNAELARVFDDEAALVAAEGEGFFINVEGKTGGPFPRDAIIKEIERGRFKAAHFVWDSVGNRWLKAAEHPLFNRFFAATTKGGGKRFYLSKEGARFGPFDYAEVEAKINAGDFDRDHFGWDNAVKKWVKLGELTDFAETFADLARREPAVPPPLPAAEIKAPAPAAPGISGLTSLVSGGPAPTAPFAAYPPAGPAPGAVVPPPAARPGPAPAPVVPPPAVAPAPVPGPGPAAPGRAEYRVGELIPIDFPEASPAGAVSLEQVEFRKVVAEEEEGPLRRPDVTVDRSVVLDFAKPSAIRRFAAQLVDLFLVAVCYFAIALIFSLIDMNPYMPGPDQYYYQRVFWGTLGGVALFYFLVRDVGGASLGKRIMGLRVVKLDDFNRAGNLFQSIARNITLLVPLVNILEIAYVFTDPKGRRLGDRAAGTVLTETNDIDYIRRHQSIMDEVY